MNTRVLLTILLLTVLMAEHSAFAVPPAEKREGLFWEISGPKGKGYLVVHLPVFDNSFFPLPKRIETALDASDVFVFRYAVSTAESRKTTESEMLSRMKLPEGKKLRALISAEAYSMASRYLSDSGLSIHRIDEIKPWVVAIMATESVASKQPRMTGVEEYVRTRAGKKPVVELGSILDEIRKLDSIPLDQQGAFLLNTLVVLRDKEIILSVIRKAWDTGRTKPVLDAASQLEAQYPKIKEFDDTFGRAQSRKDADKIVKQLESGKTVFIVTGADDAIMRYGVAAELVSRGYRIEQK